MKAFSKSIAFLVFLNCLSTKGQASDLLLSRPPNTSDLAQGVRSDQYYEGPGYPLQQAADGFSLQSRSLITRIDWWGFYLPEGASATPQQVQFRIQVFSDQGGAPSANPIYDNNTLTTVSPFMIVQDQPTYAFSAVLPLSFDAQAQTQYWLSLMENDVRTDGAFDWFNSGPARWPIGFASRPSDGGVWVVPENVEHMSFSMSGSVVPEPAVPMLLVLGVVIGFVLRRLGKLTRLLCGLTFSVERMAVGGSRLQIRTSSARRHRSPRRWASR